MFRMMKEKQKKILLRTVVRGKYSRLYAHLQNQGGQEWKTTFYEVERILGFELPDSARVHRPWWSNHIDGGHSQALAWQIAGWRVSAVDLEEESLVFQRLNSKEQSEEGGTTRKKIDIDDFLTPHNPGPWPKGFKLTREWMYEEEG